MSFDDRSTTLVELLDDLDERDLQYVLVGGYAVSVFDARFSTDLDVVVSPEERGSFVEFLESRGFEETDSHRKKWVYDTEVVEYEKRLAPQQPVGFDLLVNGLGCRQTEAQWSFDYLYDHSSQKEIRGGSAVTTARVVDGAVLVAAKLHSGRETDLRDVVAVAEEIDIETVSRHLHRGETAALREQLERGMEILDSDELRHGYRSDFGASAVSEQTVATVREYLRSQIDRVS